MGKWGDRSRKKKERPPAHARRAAAEASAAALAAGKSKEEADAAAAAALEAARQFGAPGAKTVNSGKNEADDKGQTLSLEKDAPASNNQTVREAANRKDKKEEERVQRKPQKEDVAFKGHERHPFIPWNYKWSETHQGYLLYMRRQDRWRLSTLSVQDCGAAISKKGDFHRIRFRHAVKESGFGALPAFAGRRTCFSDSEDDVHMASAPAAIGGRQIANREKEEAQAKQMKTNAEEAQSKNSRIAEERLQAHGEAFMAMFD